MPRPRRSRSVKDVFRPLQPAQRAVDFGIAGVFAFAVVPFEAVAAASRDTMLWGVLVALGFAGALAVRRLSPGLSLGIAWATAILQMVTGLVPGPSDIAIFGVLYATAAYGSSRVFWLGFASTFVGAAVITFYLFGVPLLLGSGLDGTSVITAGAAVMLAALFALGLSWTIGALVRTSIRARDNRRAQELAQRETAAEQERVRIARDMHDVVAHSLAVVIAQADGARYAAAAGPGAGADPGATTAALETISSTARSALADVRLLLTQLRHSQSEGPQPVLADLEEVYAQVRASGVTLRVDVDPAPSADPPASLQLAVYRIVQEALTNALRHGSGDAVDVRIAWLADRVELRIRNAVAATDAPPRPPGHGLIGMIERAQLVGGRLDTVRAGDEFIVTAVLPRGDRA